MVFLKGFSRGLKKLWEHIPQRWFSGGNYNPG